jgi:hypothetical protein
VIAGRLSLAQRILVTAEREGNDAALVSYRFHRAEHAAGMPYQVLVRSSQERSGNWKVAR